MFTYNLLITPTFWRCFFVLQLGTMSHTVQACAMSAV